MDIMLLKFISLNAARDRYQDEYFRSLQAFVIHFTTLKSCTEGDKINNTYTNKMARPVFQNYLNSLNVAGRKVAMNGSKKLQGTA
jgi:hypothetical protein